MAEGALTCSICFEEVMEDDKSVLECGHPFHSKCLVSWLWNSQTCPSCRACPAQSQTQGDQDMASAAQTLQLLTMHIQRVDQEHRNRRSHALRASRKSNASPLTLRAASMYRKWRQAYIAYGTDMTRMNARLQQCRQNHRKALSTLNKEFNERKRAMLREQRAEERPLRKEATSIRGRYTRAIQRSQHYMTVLMQTVET